MDNLPAGLAGLDSDSVSQFVAYELKPSQSRPGKFDKIPVHPISRTPIDPRQSSYNAQDLLNLIKGTDLGIGFYFTENDPFWFIDIDNCLLPSNQWSQTAIDIISMLPGVAIEISSSLKGLHLIGRGTAPPHSCKNSELSIEFYTSKRFVALTGINLVGDVNVDCTHLLSAVVDKYFPVKYSETVAAPNNESWSIADNEELISRACNSKSAASVFGDKASFKDLWEANADVLSKAYPDQYSDRPYDYSTADMALAQHLAFWTSNNQERMYALMHQSKLVRDKWTREDYLLNTIKNACARQTEFFKPDVKKKTPSIDNHKSPKITASDGTSYLNIEQQVEFFKGCIYVQDEHRVLTPEGSLLRPDQFRTTYGGYSFPMDFANERVTRNAWEAFTESQAFRAPRAFSTCFRPDKESGTLVQVNNRFYANLWKPVETARLEGNPDPFLIHLDKLFPKDRDRSIFTAYLAALVQYPGIKFQWCPIIQGVEGNGKTFFNACMGFAVGYQHSHFPKASQIFEKYNDWMYGKTFIGIEDIYSSRSNNSQDELETFKPMITSNQYEIRAMYSNKIMRDICCNFILNSNHKDAIKKTRNDRRFAPFYTPQQTKEDLMRDGMTPMYFSRLWKWAKFENGFEIINEFLRTYQIPDEFNPSFGHIAPVTSSTEESIEHNLGTVEQEILECVDQDIPGFKGGWISTMALNRLLVQLRADYRVPHNKRRELLQSLGYDWHPALTQGRTNTIVTPDGGKPRLFIKNDHPSRKLSSPAEVAACYSKDQL